MLAQDLMRHCLVSGASEDLLSHLLLRGRTRDVLDINGVGRHVGVGG